MTVGYWAVAFLDLMGYGAALDAFDVYPLPSDKAAQDALTPKVVRPRHFQQRLVLGIETFIEGMRSAPQTDLSHLPAEAQRLAARWRATRIKVQPLGDAVTMELALRGDDNHFPARALDMMLMAACSASLNQLAMGDGRPEDTLPLRGGIDVGTGAVIGGQLYSAALKKAVVLEDNADFPRIMVGDRLLEYVQSMANSTGFDLTTGHVRDLMRGVQELFFKDPEDGKWCLDVLGGWAANRLASDRALVRSAYAFVQQALAHYQDEYLLRKYRWLDRYMKPRLSVWGLAP